MTVLTPLLLWGRFVGAELMMNFGVTETKTDSSEAEAPLGCETVFVTVKECY